MSQHRMRVIHLSGAVAKLVAGFAPRLSEFSSSLRDVRLSAPNETPEELTEEEEAALVVKQAAEAETEDAEEEEDEGPIAVSNQKK